MRGDSEANGSWNTTCMRRRMARRCLRSALSMRSPPICTLPPLMGCSASKRHAQRGLARTRFAHDAQRLAAPQLQRGVLSRRNWRLPNQPSLKAKLTPPARPAPAPARRCRHRLHHTLRPAGQQLAGVGVLRVAKHSAVAPISTRWPRSITPTRCVKRRTRFRSWVMKSSAMPISACNSSSSARICAWMVTSSAVVGSSQISSCGLAGQRHGDHGALALAAAQLVRVDVDALFGLGDAGARQQFDARARAALGRRPRAVPAPRRSGCPP
jgi:hypothetical protein